MLTLAEKMMKSANCWYFLKVMTCYPANFHAQGTIGFQDTGWGWGKHPPPIDKQGLVKTLRRKPLRNFLN